ncbi:hypothetical protein Mnod_0410 [Methylobacterium nodulans ORS 2060]|uniref:Uncharacterized protein n=1 Tax=Methylobacterium nodulans (strain LMG 21967 / CNCM I-2342 / ORS 2060) TaxID=460265 RepID=B8IB59_METNO|nr:hypothetical protein Mnod_0410 [Methylobacterium nodulans ORS 2060]
MASPIAERGGPAARLGARIVPILESGLHAVA